MVQQASAAGGGWAFVLRDIELGRLSALLGAPDRRTVLVSGEAGVGKTQLADQALAAYRAAGGGGRRCVAGSSLREVPFGALVGLIPAHHMAAVAAGTQQLSVFAMVLEFLAASGATDDHPFVVFVDDLQHLDDASCGLLVQLIANAPLQLLATFRSGESMPDGALPLWSAPEVERLDLQPFTRHDIDGVVQQLLGPATPEVREALWQQSRGNALYLRELVVGSVAAGRIALHGGVWVLAQPLVGSLHLSEYLLQSVRRLEPVARRVADMLALCQPIPLAMLHGAELVALDQLLVAGVAVTLGDPSEREVRLSHPIYADVLCEQLTSIAERALLAEVVERIQPHRRNGDELRMTVWQLDAGGHPPIDTLVRAARSAMAARDLLLAARLTRAAQTLHPHHPQASLVLSDALYEMGDFEGSAAEATAALGVADDPHDQGLLVASLYRAYLWGLDDADGALGVVDFALAVTPDGAAQRFLQVAAANALSFSDRPRDALERLKQVDQALEFAAEGSLFAPVHEATLGQLGRTADATAVAVPSDAHALHTVVRSFCLTEHGRLDDAARLGEQLRTDVIGLALTLDQMWAALNAARAHLVAGRVRSALFWAGDAMIIAERAGLISGQALIVSVLAAAHVQNGDQPAGELAHARAEALASVKGFLRAERAVGRAWVLHGRGEHTAARKELTDGADLARAAGQVGSESFLLHERYRLGGAPSAARLAELAAACQSPLVAARAAVAAAAEAQDAVALVASAEVCAAMGAHLMAAETFAVASQLASGRLATSANSRLAQELARCEGAVTPLLTGAGQGGWAQLSAREQEVATLAISGLSAREIGERLFLSVRTVENHLQRIYTKLGAANRAELGRYLPSA